MFRKFQVSNRLAIRTDTFRKLTLGAAEKCTEGVISEMTTTSMGIGKNATIIKKLAYDISAVAENCKSQQKKISFCRQSRLRLIWKSEFLLQAANGQNSRKEMLGYQHDSKAFLFSLVNKLGWAPVKLPQKGKYSSRKISIQNLRSLGPSFGEHDMQLSSRASKNRNSVSDLGNTYSPPSGYKYQTTFAQQFLAGLLISVQMKQKRFMK